MVKKWACPHCRQMFSRLWNLNVHMERKHGGSGAALKPTIESPVEVSTLIGENPRYNEQLSPLDCSSYLDSKVKSPPSITNPIDSQSLGARSILEDVLSIIKPVVELKKLMMELNRSSYPPFVDRMLWAQSPIYLSQSPDKPNYRAASNSLPFGFRTRLCERCLSNTLHVVRYVREQEFHSCSQADLNRNREPGESFEIFRKLVDNSGNLLFNSISNFQSPSFDLLRVVRLNSQEPRGIEIVNPSDPEECLSLFVENEKSIEFDLDLLSQERDRKTALDWLRKGCIDGWAKLENDELFTYLRLVRTATFSFFRINHKGTTKNYFMYLMWA
jgi:hypothetical protein